MAQLLLRKSPRSYKKKDMHRSLIIVIFCYFILYDAAAQEVSDIQSLENKLEIYAVENPELSEMVNVNITNTSLKNFLLAVSKVHNINISFSNEMVDPPIVNNFSNVKVIDLLVFLAKEYALEYDITGNIISVSNYEPPVEKYTPNPIQANYDPQSDYLNLSLQNDSLPRVFRKLTDISGKNIVYDPQLEGKRLQGYFRNAPFKSVMEKIALSNNLKVRRSADGFFLFEPMETSESSLQRNYFNQEMISIRDSLRNLVSINVRNKPVKEVIEALTQQLNIEYFLSSPLEDAGNISIVADNINFDTLLSKIFESKRTLKGTEESSLDNNENRINNRNIIDQPKAIFTFKKDGDLYFFGTENQLALKNVEVIPMMHRSIQLLSNQSSNYRERRRNRNQMMTPPGSQYYGGNGQSNNQMNNRNFSETASRESEPQDTEEIKKIIPEKLLEGLELKIDTELNSFIVNGPAQRIERLRNFITYIDKPVPVILIEVMILEVNRSATVETGVKVGLGEKEVESSGQVFPSADIQLGASTINRIIGGFNGFGALNIGKVVPNLYMDIKALETNGNLKVLSTPKLSTLNGHKAHLSSGQTTYYAVTNQAFFGSQIPQTSEVTNYYPIDAELALDIQPYVSGNGEVTLDVNVIQSSFNGERIAEEAPPGMNSREFSSIIRMRNQDVAILGGIEQTTKDDSGSGVPLLARIPLIKWLFSERRREDSKKKLNILIKPTVIY